MRTSSKAPKQVFLWSFVIMIFVDVCSTDIASFHAMNALMVFWIALKSIRALIMNPWIGSDSSFKRFCKLLGHAPTGRLEQLLNATVNLFSSYRHILDSTGLHLWDVCRHSLVFSLQIGIHRSFLALSGYLRLGKRHFYFRQDRLNFTNASVNFQTWQTEKRLNVQAGSTA